MPWSTWIAVSGGKGASYRRLKTGDVVEATVVQIGRDAIFVDVGNVWGSPEQVDLGDIEWGPGLGLQYVTPAGPLRAEYAWRIDAPEGESGGQFFISFGVPF